MIGLAFAILFGARLVMRATAEGTASFIRIVKRVPFVQRPTALAFTSRVSSAMRFEQ